MSVNIQLENGLKKLSGQTMTKDKLIEKLGYTPANEATVSADIAEIEAVIAEHADDSSVHFSGDYNDLTNAPDIFDDASNELSIADSQGRVIFKVDEAGAHTTKLKLASGDIDTQLNTINAAIAEVSSDLTEHIESTPDIYDDKSNELVIADPSGRVIAKIDDEGLHTTNVEADAFISRDDNLIINDTDGNKIFQVDVNGVRTTKLELNSGDVDEQLVGLSARIAEVENNIPEIPVTSVNGKTGAVELEYRDLKNAPAIEAEENEDSLVITDNNGNILLRAGNLDENDNELIGIETTEIVLPGGKVDERINSVTADLSEHTGNTNIHITKAEREDWNAKATTGYVDDKVAALVNSAPETLDTLQELSAALGNDENFAATMVTELGKKALASDLAEHKTDAGHITAAERIKWNNKSDFDGAYSSLAGAPNITTDEEDNSLLIADETGNIVFKAGVLDENITGVETTIIKAQEAEISNVYTKTEVDDKIASYFGSDGPIQDEVYVQSEEPVDAPDGSIWVDIDEISGGTLLSGSVPSVTTNDDGKMLQVVNGEYALVTIENSAIKTYIDNYINEALGGDY